MNKRNNDDDVSDEETDTKVSTHPPITKIEDVSLEALMKQSRNAIAQQTAIKRARERKKAKSPINWEVVQHQSDFDMSESSAEELPPQGSSYKDVPIARTQKEVEIVAQDRSVKFTPVSSPIISIKGKEPIRPRIKHSTPYTEGWKRRTSDTPDQPPATSPRELSMSTKRRRTRVYVSDSDDAEDLPPNEPAEDLVPTSDFFVATEDQHWIDLDTDIVEQGYIQVISRLPGWRNITQEFQELWASLRLRRNTFVQYGSIYDKFVESIQTRHGGTVTYRKLEQNINLYITQTAEEAFLNNGSVITTAKLKAVLAIVLDCYELKDTVMTVINKAIRATTRQPKYTLHLDPMFIYKFIPLDVLTNSEYTQFQIRDFLVTLLKLESAHRGADLSKAYREEVTVIEPTATAKTRFLSFKVYEPKNITTRGSYAATAVTIPENKEFPHLDIISLWIRYRDMTESIAPHVQVLGPTGSMITVTPMFISPGKKHRGVAPLNPMTARKANAILTSALTAAGYKESSHVLRGAVGTEMLANGCAIAEVCKHLDVTLPVFTQSYYRPEFEIDRSSLPPVPRHSHPIFFLRRRLRTTLESAGVIEGPRIPSSQALPIVAPSSSGASRKRQTSVEPGIRLRVIPPRPDLGGSAD